MGKILCPIDSHGLLMDNPAYQEGHASTLDRILKVLVIILNQEATPRSEGRLAKQGCHNTS